MARANSYLTMAGAVAAALALPVVSAWAQGDTGRGYDLARSVCADCHGIDKDDVVSPNSNAPTFQAIATTRGMSAMALSIFLRTPHATMPNLVLSDSEMADVINYIMTLKE